MKLKYKIGIATKMILMVTTIVVGSIGIVVYIASDLFQEDSVTRVQEINKETAEHLGQRVESVFEDSFNRLTLMAQFATRSANKEEAIRAISNTLSGSDDLVSFVAYQIGDDGKLNNMYTVVQDSILAELGLTADQIRDKPRNRILLEQLNDVTKMSVVNAAPDLNIPIFSISFISKDSKDNVAVNPKFSAAEKLKQLKGRWLFRTEIRQDPILKLFVNKNFQSSYLVDRNGHLLAHSDPSLMSDVIAAADYSSNPIVWKLVQEHANNQQMEYMGDDGESYLGAFKKVDISGIGVVTEVSKKHALATINRVQYRSFLVMIIVVCAAFIMNFLFSQSLTLPLKKLFSATQQIVTGNYNVDLKSNSQDEIGALSTAFLNMTEGLKEREKLKGAFSKFHSKEIAQKLLSGEIKLGGERKHATIFFSDIRGFTHISENLSPDQVVAILNEYMTEMVKIIYKWHGVVDKYVGDAIMAEWGIPNTTGDDAYNAVRAALEMRAFLVGFNQMKKDSKMQEIHIGIGIHSGDVLAGNIGSEERLEYTVIGDTVNQAARIEAANKALSTDFLISETTYLLVKERGIDVGPVLYIKAKGKTDPLKVYKVIGYVDENKVLQTALTPEKIAEIKSQHDIVITNDEEKVQSIDVVNHAVHHELKRMENTVSVIHLGPSTSTEIVRDEIFEGTQTGINKILDPYSDTDTKLFVTRTELQELEKANHEDIPEWFLVDPIAGNAPQGPFSLIEIKLKAKANQIDVARIHGFRPGDSETTPVYNLPGMEKRRELPPIIAELPPQELRSQAIANDWYVRGIKDAIMGPFKLDQLKLALDNGHLTRTTFAWTKDYLAWIYLFQIPDFNRRKNEMDEAA